MANLCAQQALENSVPIDRCEGCGNLFELLMSALLLEQAKATNSPAGTNFLRISNLTH